MNTLKCVHDMAGNLVSRTVATMVSVPEITGQPTSYIAEPGNLGSFSVVVRDATGLTFQWRFNGSEIPGATGDSLVITNVGGANVGQYVVVVTNSAGSVTTAPAELLLDSDRDGLPDSWEIAKFGDLTSQRSEGDPDADSVSNIDEFRDHESSGCNVSPPPLDRI